jgi:hypothetical protein
LTANSTNTVSQTPFETRKVIDRAFGRCKIAPEKISDEYIEIALDMLYLFLSTLSSNGISLWTITKVILPLYDAVQSVQAPLGTVDILNANLRTSNRLSGTYSASEGNAALAFDGNLATACTQTDAGGYIQIQFQSPTATQIYGILPNASGVWNIAIQTSVDGFTWESVYVNPTLSMVDGQWFWVDIEGIPESGVNYVRLQAYGLTVLDVTEFVQQNLPEEIPIAKINRDDYANLPDKWQLPGRPVQFWYDKQIDQPILTLWPPPSAAYQLNQLVLYVQMYVQDVGSLTQQLAIPQRWFLAIVSELARQLSMTIPEVSDPNLMAQIAAEADRQLAVAWASENDGSPTYLQPAISCYTK